MRGFVPTFTAYRVNHRLFQNVHEVPIKYIGSSHPQFRGRDFFKRQRKEDGSARERVVRIFARFSGLTTLFRQWKSSRAKLDTPIAISSFTVAHRIYCSLAAGFTCVPSIKDFGSETEQVSAEDTEGWQFSAKPQSANPATVKQFLGIVE